MRIFITFFAMIALANASVLYPLNELGSYGINDGSIARQEIRTPDGIVRGTYTYIDGDGKTKAVQYGGDNGDGIPKAPVSVEEQQDESPQQSQEMDGEVVESLAGVKNETKEESMEDDGVAPTLPEAVTYTPEVAAAREAHFAARDQAIYLQQVISNQQQQQLLNQQILGYSPFFNDYYGAAKQFRTVNPFYGYLL